MEGRVAIVTGAGRGIGRATALLLAARGARVLGISRTESELASLAAEAPVEVLAETVATEEGCERVVVEARSRLGPVEILASSHRAFNIPNRITKADFDGWVEQRGSKFFSEWDGAYTPMIETHDQGQPPQKGGWLTATYGNGHYTYFAYAFHRQLPYAVPGAYRLLANLLSLGKAR